jgi:hypothetical protein
LIVDPAAIISTAMTRKTIKTGKYISIGEACRLLNKRESEVRALMADGRLRHRRINDRFGDSGAIVIRYRDVLLLQASYPTAGPKLLSVRPLPGEEDETKSIRAVLQFLTATGRPY